MARLLHHQNRWSDQPVEENLEKYNPGLLKEQLEMLWKNGRRLTSANRCACFGQAPKRKSRARSGNSTFDGGTPDESKWKRFSQQLGSLRR